MSDDLVEWLRAQLDVDQELALAASPGPWSPDAEAYEVVAVDGVTVADGFALSGPQLRATVRHIASWDPSRVLREVEAGRKLIKRYENAVAAVEQGSISGWIRGQDDGYMQACLDAIKDRAEALSDRPGYREEWRPT